MNKHTTINAIMNIISAPNRKAEWNVYDKAEQIWELFEKQAKNLQQSDVSSSVCVNHGERTYNEENGIVYCSLCKKPC